MRWGSPYHLMLNLNPFSHLDFIFINATFEGLQLVNQLSSIQPIEHLNSQFCASCFYFAIHFFGSECSQYTAISTLPL